MAQIPGRAPDIEVVSPHHVPAATDKMSFTGFTTWCAAVLAAGALLATAFVAVVDPYHLTGLVEAEGFNQIKPLPEQYREQIKVAQARAIHPNLILLGNSRIEVGFDPESEALRTHGFSAYNLGLAGTGIPTSQRVFEQIRKGAVPPAKAVIGVEFLDFLVKPDAVPATPGTSPSPSWQWRVDTLFSLKAMTDAVRTLRIQKAPEVETLSLRGHTPLYEYRKYARQEGYYAIFQQRAQENAKNLVRKPHNLFANASSSSESIDRLRDLLRTMTRDGTEVHLVIYPYHAQLMAMFEEAGLHDTMEEWKRVLVREVEAARSRQPNARVTLWDFSGFTPVQCERIPAPGDMRSITQWYWEGGHFKTSVGELIVRRLLGDESSFGVPLTAQNLEQNRQRIQAERATCANAYPQLFSSARSLVAEARSRAH